MYTTDDTDVLRCRDDDWIYERMKAISVAEYNVNEFIRIWRESWSGGLLPRLTTPIIPSCVALAIARSTTNLRKRVAEKNHGHNNVIYHSKVSFSDVVLFVRNIHLWLYLEQMGSKSILVLGFNMDQWRQFYSKWFCVEYFHCLFSLLGHTGSDDLTFSSKLTNTPPSPELNVSNTNGYLIVSLERWK